jgi:hypothetical protein
MSLPLLVSQPHRKRLSLGAGNGSERATQLIHFAWTLLAVLLLWHWGTKIWSIEVGRKILFAAGSNGVTAHAGLMALCRYGAGLLRHRCTYTPSHFMAQQLLHGCDVAGIMAGLAIGVKYTSFVVPLTCGLLILFSIPTIYSSRESHLPRNSV